MENLDENRIISKWKFFSIQENPIHALLFICMGMLLVQLFQLLNFREFWSHFLNENTITILRNQPYKTNLQGYVFIPYTIVTILYSYFFYKKNKVIFDNNSQYTTKYLFVTIFLVAYFIFIGNYFRQFNDTCNLDVLGGCGLVGMAAVLFAIFIYLFIFQISLFIFKKSYEKQVEFPQDNKTFLWLIISVMLLLFWITTIRNAVTTVLNKDKTISNEINAYYQNEANTREMFFKNIATSSKDSCLDAPNDFYLFEGDHPDRVGNSFFHFPKGFTTGIGYIYISPENYWDGSLSEGNDNKYVTNWLSSPEYTDFSNSDSQLIEFDRQGGVQLNKNLTYDVRVAVITDPDTQDEIKSGHLFRARSSLKVVGQASGEGEIPLTFAKVFPSYTDCVTVRVR